MAKIETSLGTINSVEQFCQVYMPSTQRELMYQTGSARKVAETIAEEAIRRLTARLEAERQQTIAADLEANEASEE